MIKLTVQSPDESRDLEFAETAILIGRAAECALKITDIKSSRRHAQIEKQGAHWVLTDLDSPNGTSVNGIDVTTAALRAGDEIRIGSTLIVVRELDTPPPAGRAPQPAPAADPKPVRPKSIEIARTRLDDRRAGNPLKTVLGLCGLFLVLVVLAATLRDVFTPSPAPARVSAPRARTDAERALADLRARMERATTVSEAMIAEAYEHSRTYGSQLAQRSGGLNPFDQLISAMHQRRAGQVNDAIARARDGVELALSERRYAAALQIAAELHSALGPLYAESIAELVAQVDARINEDYLMVVAQGSRLEQAKRYLDAAAHYRAHAPRFKDTKHFVVLAGKPDTLAAMARAEAETLARKESTAPPPPVSETSAEAEAPAVVPPIVAGIVEAVGAGRFSGKSYRFESGAVGTPVSADAEQIRLQGPAGQTAIAWSALAPAQIFQLASDGLRGEDLLGVAEYGYRHGLGAQADQLLFRLFSADKKHQARIDRVIAAARGLAAVPEGGYAYDAKFGWEDAVQRDNRTAIDLVRRHLRDLAASGDRKRREALFQKAIELYDKPTLTAESRAAIKEAAVGAIKAWKKKNLDEIAKKAKSHSGFGQLRALKVELNKRRKAALDVIYDESIYLREDHPDWTKGDQANGQSRVDALVKEVRDLWERSGSLVVGMNVSITRDLAEIREANELYLRTLGEEVDTEAELKEFEEITCNLSEQLNIKSVCLNAAERQLYDWNRRVDRYNEQLQHPDITADEKAHAKVLNDYREMMGRRRLFLEPRLCRATKKHSAVCNAAGRIWHVGPDGDPQSRAQAEGFTAGVAENVALGYATPADVWTLGWYRASDHHRNGLAEGHNCIGYGYVGNVGTQNFSNIGPPKGF